MVKQIPGGAAKKYLIYHNSRNKSLQYINGMNYLFVLEIKENDKTIFTDSRPNP